VIKHIRNLQKNISGVISIEITLVISYILLLIFAILEFTIMYSLRSGLETISRDISRNNLSATGGSYNLYLQGGGADSRDIYFTRAVYRRISNIISKPENIELCITVYNSLNSVANETGGIRECRNFQANNTPASMNWGDSGQFVQIKITYEHDFISPIGTLLQGFAPDNNLIITSHSYARVE